MKSSPTEITGDQLATVHAGPNRPRVIDVLPEEEYNSAHIPGAENACVFKVSFLDEIQKLVSSRNDPVVVYGFNRHDLASTTAAQKLLAAGYTQVANYKGGLEDWRGAGRHIEGNSSRNKDNLRLSDGLYPVDVEKSTIHWAGRNLMSAHYGTLRLRVGQVEVRQGRPARGAFTLDMDSIQNTDIQDPQLRQVLVQHLKSDDFFDVGRFPVAEFQLSQLRTLPEATAGSPNFEAVGSLTLKGVTRDIVFQTILAPTSDGRLAADAHLDIDRTQWNVLYGSGKFYQKLGKHLVNDDISLGLKLLTLPASKL